jgi:putative nucleotidyltransferase with HDIG domain
VSSLPPTESIDVQALRVGMFVHLDVGWMAHPFPRSAFRIADDGQLETIRALGLARVRWCPELSEVVQASAELVGDAPEPPPAAAEAEAGPAPTLQAVYDAAAGESARVMALVAARPAEAKAAGDRLVRALLDGMPEGDVTMRAVEQSQASDPAGSHGLNVAVVSLLMGRLFGFGADDLHELGVGALLHDIGKLALPERVRHVDERTTPGEAKRYREHVDHGIAAARRLGLPPTALAVVAQHHEASDGSGFPYGFNADRIALAARIVAIVDRFDDLCNPPRAERALTPHEAVSLMFAEERRRFDPSILNAFIKMVGVYPPGSVVQLTDDRWAMVVSVHASRPLKPTVRVFDPALERDDAPLLDLQRSAGVGIRRSVRAHALPGDVAAWLRPGRGAAWLCEPAAPEGPDAAGAGDAEARQPETLEAR